MLARLSALVAPDAAALDCVAELRHLNKVASLGSSADVQLALYRRERECLASREAALDKVVDWLAAATAATHATPAPATQHRPGIQFAAAAKA